MLETAPGAALLGLLLGGAFGALVQRTHFCTMGALADLALFGDSRRLRAWLLAIGVGLAGTQALTLVGTVDPLRALEAATPGLVSAAFGGLLFGYGMTQTGGCVSRNLILLGTGSLKAMMVLTVVALLAAATLGGVLAPLRAALDGLVPAPSLPMQDPVAAGLACAVGLGICIWCLLEPRFRRAPRELAAGAGTGLLVTLGWLAASTTSLNPVLGLDALLTGLLQGSQGAGLLIAFVVAVPFGAFAIARGAGAVRLTTFVDGADLRRHLGGAVLMGVGGGLAAGCTLGQGISGVATLALPSWLALTGFILGGLAGVRALEHGSLRGAWRARFAGWKG